MLILVKKTQLPGLQRLLWLLANSGYAAGYFNFRIDHVSSVTAVEEK